MTDLLPGFQRQRLRVNGVTINLARGGGGSPVLLLHGYPQTHAMWHAIAPRLAERHSVVCADLRGYGDSAKPKGLPDHANYSKRAMAADMVAVMQRLGHERFHVVGHDRGGRVGHRLARDHGDRVRSLTVIDISPTLAMYERTDMAFATAYYHWFLLIQPAPLPEQMIAAIGWDGVFGRLAAAAGGRGRFDPRALAAYRRCFDKRTIHASCEDYRAAATIDLEHDRADRGRKLTMPLLALWGRRSVVGTMFDCRTDWQAVADDVTGRAIDCSHFAPEEQPAATLAPLQRFLRRCDAREH